jgi:hypothetical protein
METRSSRTTRSTHSNLCATQHLDHHSAVKPQTSNKTTDQQLQSSNVEDVLNFYDRALIPKEKVCPFSDPSRPNPCTTHATPKKRKDIIQNHLLQIKQKGYDAQHPANDPLWESWAINKYWLVSRPSALIKEEDKKAARSKAARKSYQTRLNREEREAANRKRQYEEGLISFDEYKSILVGHKRWKAEKEYLESQIKKQEQRLEEEYVLRLNLEKKIEELQAKLK